MRHRHALEVQDHLNPAYCCLIILVLDYLKYYNFSYESVTYICKSVEGAYQVVKQTFAENQRHDLMLLWHEADGRHFSILA